MGILFVDHRDPGLIGEIRRLQRLPFSQRMRLRQGQQHAIVQHLRIVQILIVAIRRRIDQRHVQATLPQPFELHGRRLAVKHDVHIRPGHPQRPQCVRQNAGVHRIFDIADAQPAVFPPSQAAPERLKPVGVRQ